MEVRLISRYYSSCSRFRRVTAADFSSNERLNGRKRGEKESVTVNVKIIPLNVNLNLKLCCNVSPETSAIMVFAPGEDSFTQNVCHFPEKCCTDLDLFEIFYGLS